VREGQKWCRWHDPSTEARARHHAESVKGGSVRPLLPPSVEPIADAVKGCDTRTPRGLVSYLSATLDALATLPFSTGVAHAVVAAVNAQRATIETSTFAQRLDALEQHSGVIG
jgi:hypothetical protein